MRIFINTVDEPVYIGKVIRHLILRYPGKIVGINIVPEKNSPGAVLKRLKDNFKLLLILGFIDSIKIATHFLYYKLRATASLLMISNPYSINSLSQNAGIPVFNFKEIHGNEFLKILENLKVDLVINQAPYILEKNFLSVPKIGTINRHASLLPKNRGRLAPFRTLYNREPFAGISIHFVDEQIDHGPIIVQKKIKITKQHTFKKLLDELFDLTPEAFDEAFKKLNSSLSESELIKNNDSVATYFSYPTLREVWNYKKSIIKKQMVSALKLKKQDIHNE